MSHISYPDREAAFPGRSLESFSGDIHQLRAICAAVAIRNMLEDQHAGVVAEPGDLVTWAGGTCRYGEAARISPQRLSSFAKSANRKISRDLAKAADLAAGVDENAMLDFMFRAQCASKWVLPQSNPAAVRRLAADIRRQLPANAWSSRAREAAVSERCLDQEVVVRSFFASHTEGCSGPDDASGRGEEVFVETAQGRFPWEEVSHINDAEIMAFNIRLCDHILSVIDAVEEAALLLQQQRKQVQGRAPGALNQSRSMRGLPQRTCHHRSSARALS